MVPGVFRLLLILASVSNLRCGDRQGGHPEAGPPILPDKKLNAAFLVVAGVHDSELIAPMDVLQHTVVHTGIGIQVFTVAATRDTLTTFEGLRLIPDFSFANDSLPSIDILVVPSARHSADSDLENTDLLNFIRKTKHEAAYVISLSDGAFVLAKAGVLDLHESTTFPDDVTLFRQTFPKLKVHENVSFVHDRQVITAAGGAKSYEPALYLVELLYGKQAADAIARGLVINWDLSKVQAVITRR